MSEHAPKTELGFEQTPNEPGMIDLTLELKIDLTEASLRVDGPELRAKVEVEHAGAPRPLAKSELQALVALLEREAEARKESSDSAALHHEVGRLCEEQLEDPARAALAYQAAFQRDPRFLENLFAAQRLFSESCNWHMVVQLLDAELSLESDTDDRVMRAIDKARILADHLEQQSEATACAERCLEQATESFAVLDTLRRAYSSAEDAQRLERILGLLAQSATDPAMKAACWELASSLCEGALCSPEKANEHAQRAWHTGRAGLGALDYIERAAESAQENETLADVLQARADQLGPSTLAAATLGRLARLLQRNGRNEEALSALTAAHEMAPSDAWVFEELCWVLHAARKMDELAALLRGFAEKSEGRARVEPLLRLAAIYEDELQRDEEAIACYRQVLAEQQNESRALSALGRIAARQENWQGLYDILEIEAARDGAEPRQRADTLFRAARLLETRLERPLEALARYRMVLELVPRHFAAQKSLLAMLERLGRWDEVLQLLEEELSQTVETDSRIATLSRVAQIHELKRGDVASAVAALERLLELAPNHLHSIAALARLASSAGMWKTLVRANEMEASLVSDTRRAVALLHDNAEILEARIGDADGAIATWQRLLALQPTYLPGLQALGRLFRIAGRVEDLVAMHRREAELASEPSRAAQLLVAAGELLEEKLGRIEDALECYQSALKASPGFKSAELALSRVLRRTRAFERLADLMQEIAERRGGSAKSDQLFALAILCDEELGRPKQARELLEETLRLTPFHAGAAEALLRLLDRRGELKERAALLERIASALADSGARSEEQAGIAALRALASFGLPGDENRHALFDLHLELSPDSLTALLALEGLERAPSARRGELRLRLASSLTDPSAVSHYQLGAASDLAPTDPERATEALALGSALALGAQGRFADTSLANSWHRSERYTELAERLRERLELLSDSQSRRALLARLAELDEWYLGDQEGALARWRELLELSPDFLPALCGVKRVLEHLERWQELAEFCIKLGDSVQEPHFALECFREAGLIYEERLHVTEAALGAYKRALALDPTDAVSSKRAEALLQEHADPLELASMLLKRASARASENDFAAAAKDYVGAASHFASAGKPENALETLQHVLVLDPKMPEALGLKAELCIKAGRHDDAMEALHARLELAGDERELARVHFQIAQLIQSLPDGDASQVAAHLQNCVALDPAGPNSLEALERLGSLYLAANAHQGAVEAWGAALGLIDRMPHGERPLETKTRLHLSLAYALEMVNRLDEAASHYVDVLHLAPETPELVDRLAALYERMGAPSRLAELMEAESARALQKKNRVRASELRARAASVWEQLSMPERSIKLYRSALDEDPQDLRSRIALAELMGRDPQTGAQAIDMHRSILQLTPFRLESLHALYKLFNGTRQLDKAIVVLNMLSFLRALTPGQEAVLNDSRARLPSEPSNSLTPEDLEQSLLHPATKGTLSALIALMGDNLAPILRPGASGGEQRCRPEHPFVKMVRAYAEVFSLSKLEIMQDVQGPAIRTDTAAPLTIISGPEFARSFKVSEQRALIAGACLQVRNRWSVPLTLRTLELRGLVQCAIKAAGSSKRQVDADPEVSRKIRKALSFKVLKQIESLIPELDRLPNEAIDKWRRACVFSVDRAALLMSGDISSALQLIYARRQPARSADPTPPTPPALEAREEMREAFAYLLSPEHFRLRNKLKLAFA